jgi:hypothetical protein
MIEGSGSGRPKNTWIRIRIRNTAFKERRPPFNGGRAVLRLSPRHCKMKESLVSRGICASPAQVLALEAELDVANVLQLGVAVEVLGLAEGQAVQAAAALVDGVEVLVQVVVVPVVVARGATEETREVGRRPATKFKY